VCRFAHGGRARMLYARSAEINTMRGLSMGVIWIVVGLVTAGGLAGRIVFGRATAAPKRIWDSSAISGLLNTGFHTYRTTHSTDKTAARLAQATPREFRHTPAPPSCRRKTQRLRRRTAGHRPSRRKCSLITS
jgi:hypothetical protein